MLYPAGTDIQSVLDYTGPGQTIELADGDYSGPIWLRQPRTTLKLADAATIRGGLITVAWRDLDGDEYPPNAFDPKRRALSITPNRRMVAPSGGIALRRYGYLQQDCWTNCRQFTVDFAFKSAPTQVDGCGIFGIVADDNAPSPIAFIHSAVSRRFYLQLKLTTGAVAQASWACPDTTQLAQESFSVNLDTGTVLAWNAATGESRPVQLQGFYPGMHLQPNGLPKLVPFQFIPALYAYEIHGFRLTFDYRASSETNPLARYFAGGTYFAGTVSDRYVTFVSFGASDRALLLDSSQLNGSAGPYTITGGRFRSEQNLGAGILLGAGVGTTQRISNVYCDGGAHGISSLYPAGTLYPLYIDDCELHGWESPLNLRFGEGTVSRCWLKYAARCFARFDDWGEEVNDIYTTDIEYPDMLAYAIVIGSDDEYDLDINAFRVDHESGNQPLAGLIASHDGAKPLTVRLGKYGNLKLTAPLARLDGRGPGQLVLCRNKTSNITRNNPNFSVTDIAGNLNPSFVSFNG
jgi:hypothetical protein